MTRDQKKFYPESNYPESPIRVSMGLTVLPYFCRLMKAIVSFLIRFVPRKYLQRVSWLGLKIVGLFYIGNKVWCPICEHRYRIFLPYGRTNPRSNALCPNCQSLERHRLLWLYLNQKTNFFNTQLMVLHIAPEACFMKRFERQHGKHYITADIESPLAKIKMDIHKIPFEPNTIDVILCNHVLEHVEDDQAAMREFNRVLKPGAWAILQVPFFSPVPDKTFEDNTMTDPAERERIFGQRDHVRKYGKDYATRISYAGFEVMEDDFVTIFSDEDLNKFGLQKNEIIYRAIKK